MRLREILNIINLNYESLKIESSSDDYGYTRIKNYKDIQVALINLGKIKVFEERTLEILSGNFDGIISISIRIENDEYNEFNSKINDFKNEIFILRNILNNLLNKQEENTLSIKLYNFDDFDDFSNFSDSFNKKVLLPLKRINMNVSIGDFEIGSRWIDIIIETAIGVKVLTYIFTSAFDILTKYQKYKMLTALTSTFNDSKDLLKHFNEELLEKRKKLCIKESEGIVSKLEKDDEFNIKEFNLNEFKNSITISIEESIKLMDKGLEIHKALDVDNNKKYKLPDYKKLIDLKAKEKQEQLEDNTDIDNKI